MATPRGTVVARSLHYGWFPLRDCPMAIAAKNAIYSWRKTEAKKRRGISAAFYAASARLEEKEGKGMESA